MSIQEYKDARLNILENQINNLKECAHQNKEIRCRTASNGSKMYRFQCTRCGATFGNWISHHEIENPEKIKEIDDNIRNNYFKTCQVLQTALFERKRMLEKTDFDQWYKEYLRSPEWHEKKELIIRRCGGICEGCGKNYVKEIHHLTYKNVGKEFLFELVGLCLSCHKKYHEGGAEDD